MSPLSGVSRRLEASRDASGRLAASLGRLWFVFGASGAAFGPLWGVFGASWGVFGTSLERLCGVSSRLGASRGASGRDRFKPGPFLGPLGGLGTS